MAAWISPYPNLNLRNGALGLGGRRVRGRRLKSIADQQGKVTGNPQHGHDTQICAQGWRRVACLNRSEGRPGDADALGHLNRAKALSLPQAFDAVAEYAAGCDKEQQQIEKWVAEARSRRLARY